MGTELFPKVSATKWAKRYNIEIRSRPCQKCGITQKTTIPWASKDWRGLVAPIHECGEEYELVTAVPTNNAERDSWRSFINLWGEIVSKVKKYCVTGSVEELKKHLGVMGFKTWVEKYAPYALDNNENILEDRITEELAAKVLKSMLDAIDKEKKVTTLLEDLIAFTADRQYGSDEEREADLRQLAACEEGIKKVLTRF